MNTKSSIYCLILGLSISISLSSAASAFAQSASDVDVGNFLSDSTMNQAPHIYRLTQGSVIEGVYLMSESECFSGAFSCDHDSSSVSGKEIPLNSADQPESACLVKQQAILDDLKKSDSDFLKKMDVSIASPMILDNRDGKIIFESKFLNDDFIRVEENSQIADEQHHITIPVYTVLNKSGQCEVKTKKDIEDRFFNVIRWNDQFYKSLAASDSKRFSKSSTQRLTSSKNLSDDSTITDTKPNLKSPTRTAL